jgi:hypothetical protein
MNISHTLWLPNPNGLIKVRHTFSRSAWVWITGA